MPTRSKLGSSHQGSSVFAVPIQEPKPNRSMMEPAEDWYRCDAAEEDFFNSLLGCEDPQPNTQRPRGPDRGCKGTLEPEGSQVRATCRTGLLPRGVLKLTCVVRVLRSPRISSYDRGLKRRQRAPCR